jgi:hypothetical protein
MESSHEASGARSSNWWALAIIFKNTSWQISSASCRVPSIRPANPRMVGAWRSNSASAPAGSPRRTIPRSSLSVGTVAAAFSRD